MSKEGINKFILDVNKNSKLTKILKKAKKSFNSHEERFEYISAEAKKHGYDFTASDMILAMGEHSNSLLDDDLSNVAGGESITNTGSLSSDHAKKFWKLIR